MTETDAVIVGAGPAGLFQVFQLGLQEVQAHVIDVLPAAGGQCVELYADKPIYDIPGIPYCTGQQLTDNLLAQAAPFKPQFHFGQLVSGVSRQADQRLLVATSAGQQFLTRTLFIAAGVGAFQPKTIKVPGLEALQSGSLSYHLDQNADWHQRRVVIVGDTEAALQSALWLADRPAHQRPASVTLMHRRDAFQAEDGTLQIFRQQVAGGKLHFLAAQPTQIDNQSGKLTQLHLLRSDGQVQPLPADHLLIQLGISPKLGPLADWGLAMERKQLWVDTETFQTSESGIFAVGDINTYPGKKKLIVCAFHECVMAAFGALPILFPDKRIALQYTTTSPRLHALLGVDTPGLSGA